MNIMKIKWSSSRDWRTAPQTHGPGPHKNLSIRKRKVGFKGGRWWLRSTTTSDSYCVFPMNLNVFYPNLFSPNEMSSCPKGSVVQMFQISGAGARIWNIAIYCNTIWTTVFKSIMAFSPIMGIFGINANECDIEEGNTSWLNSTSIPLASVQGVVENVFLYFG